MALLAAMLPIYLMGNLHCLGMCGPIAMLLSRAPFRVFYLLGRLVSFTLAGFLAGAFGEVLAISLHQAHLSGLLSLVFGGLIFIFGCMILCNVSQSLALPLGRFRDQLNQWLFSQEPWPLFLVGILTVALPCGQTLLVFSACALSGSAETGLLNGFAFGLLTTPSLYIAMRGAGWFMYLKRFYRPVVGGLSLLIGLVAILRALADWGVIPHFGIHPVMIY